MMQHNHIQNYMTKILVDAPCSGLGVLRHKPEIKYVQSNDSINDLVEIQLSILDNVKHNLKPGVHLFIQLAQLNKWKMKM